MKHREGLAYASAKHVNAAVHEWRPVTPEMFVKALHAYNIYCCDAHGHEALNTTAVRMDRDTTATFYFMPKRGQVDISHGISSPVLLTMHTVNGGTERLLCFESLKYGLVPNKGDLSQGSRPHHLDYPDEQSMIKPGTKATHRCKECRAEWVKHPDGGGWSLASPSCGPCCDNVAMGDQIEPLDRDEMTP